MPISTAPLYQASFELIKNKSCVICEEPFLEDAKTQLQATSQVRCRTFGVVYSVKCIEPHVVHLRCFAARLQSRESDSVVSCTICERKIDTVDGLTGIVNLWQARDDALNRVLRSVVQLKMGFAPLNVDEFKEFVTQTTLLKGNMGSDKELKKLYGECQYLIGQQYLLGWDQNLPEFTTSLALNAFIEAETFGHQNAPDAIESVLEDRVQFDEFVGKETTFNSLASQVLPLDECMIEEKFERFSHAVLMELRTLRERYPTNEKIACCFFEKSYEVGQHLYDRRMISEDVLNCLEMTRDGEPDDAKIEAANILLDKIYLLRACRLLGDSSVIDQAQLLQGLADLQRLGSSKQPEILSQVQDLQLQLPSLVSKKIDHVLDISQKHINKLTLNEPEYGLIMQHMEVVKELGTYAQQKRADVLCSLADRVFAETKAVETQFAVVLADEALANEKMVESQ